MGDTLHADIRFSIVPETVLDADISDRAVRVYGILARYADSETGKCFPSRETLARRARCHWRSVDRAIQELIKIGALEKHYRRDGEAYKSNLYVIKRVVTGLSGGTDTGVTGVLTPQSVGTDTGGNLTRTTELEPKNDNHLTRQSKMTADDYKPTDEFLQKLATEYPGVRLEVELEKFRDHHMANGSSFKIWDRAFRKWIRQASDWSPEARAARVRAEEEAKFEQWKRDNGE